MNKRTTINVFILAFIILGIVLFFKTLNPLLLIIFIGIAFLVGLFRQELYGWL